MYKKLHKTKYTMNLFRGFNINSHIVKKAKISRAKHMKIAIVPFNFVIDANAWGVFGGFSRTQSQV